MWQPGREGGWGRTDACVCMTASLRCPPETIAVLSTGYTPIQNKKFNVSKKINKIMVIIEQGPFQTSEVKRPNAEQNIFPR